MTAKTKKLFNSYLFDGLLLIALGVVMLLWSGAPLKVLCNIIGIILIVIGAIKAISFIANKNNNRKITGLLIGLLQLAAGIILLVKSDFFVSFFQYVTAALLLYGCFLLFRQAYKLRAQKGTMFTASIVFACITLVLAVVMIVNPTALASFITQLNGVSLIIEGLAMIVALRKNNN